MAGIGALHKMIHSVLWHGNGADAGGLHMNIPHKAYMGVLVPTCY